MKKFKNILFFIVLASVLFCCCAFRLPAESTKDLIPTETLQNQINNFKLITIITLFALMASIIANILTTLYLFKMQAQLNDMVYALKNYNATSDAVNKIAEGVRAHTQTAGQDNIEIMKRGT